MGRRTAVVTVALLVLLAGCTAIPSDVVDAGSDIVTGTDAETGTESETSTDDGPRTESDEDAGTGTTDDGDVDGELEVHFINVGQADATLIIGPTGETMLIDSGDWRNDGATVIDYLEAHDVDRIDYLVSTHGHADHIGGHAAIIEHYETELDGIGAAYDNGVPHTSQTYGNYLDAVEEHDVTLYEVREGDHVPFEGVNVTVFNPAEDTEADDLHDDSIAFHLAFGTTSFLFTGDAESAAEARMTDTHGDDLDADVYHAGHHGSDTSSIREFMEAVDPAIAVISSSYESQYGHPHEEVLDRFAGMGVDAYWTATHGTTVMTSDGASIVVATQHDATTEPTDLRSAEEATADPTDDPEEHAVYDEGALSTVHAAPALTTTPPPALVTTSPPVAAPTPDALLSPSAAPAPNANVAADLTGANLTGADLAGVDLAGVEA